MPILVFKSSRCFLRQVIASISFGAMVCLLGLVAEGKSVQTPNERLSPPPTGNQTSILVQDVNQPSVGGNAPGANGVARTGDSTALESGTPPSNANMPATFTSQLLAFQDDASIQMADAPTPPQQLLNTPNPSADPLRSPSGNDLPPATRLPQPPSTFQAATTEAIGTYASSQQPTQNQPTRPLGPPPSTRFLSPNPEVQPSQFGTLTPNSVPPPAQRFSQPVGDRASPWRAAPPNAAAQLNPSLSGTPQERLAVPGQVESNRRGRAMLNNAVAPTNPAGSQYGSSILANQGARVSPASLPGQDFNRGNHVRQIGYNQPISSDKQNTANAQLLMVRYSLDNVREALPGNPVKLVEMFQQTMTAAQRQGMVNLYWQTYRDWAVLVSARQQLQWLAQVSTTSTAGDNARLATAKLVAENRALAFEIELVKSQARLLRYLPNRNSGLLPLPSDRPLIKKYTSNYDLYRAKNLIPPQLLGADRVLLKTFELIGNRAAAVELAKTAADQTRAGLATRQTTLTAVLESARAWQEAEQDLISTVTSYNQTIAGFSLTMSRKDQTPEQFAYMLIGSPELPSVQGVTRDTTPPRAVPAGVAVGTPNQHLTSNAGRPTPRIQGQPVAHSIVAPTTPITTFPSTPAQNAPATPAATTPFGGTTQPTSPFGERNQVNPTGDDFATPPIGTSPSDSPAGPPTIRGAVPQTPYPDRSAASGTSPDNSFGG